MKDITNKFLSKKTCSFAKSFGFDLNICLGSYAGPDENRLVLEIYETIVDFSEPMFLYTFESDAKFHYHANIYLPLHIKEEIPAVINDEKHLREVIKFIHEEMKK